ncbi:MAG: FAD-binding oxidoreductase [Actinomycetota bacterium]|nr:FAD-binding oxidoreductase [Actinomycetota bacterium]
MTAVDELSDLIGSHRVSIHPADLQRHSTDRSPSALLARRRGDRPLSPLCVTRPRTTEQVSQILKWANRTRTPVIPYGGGSAVCEQISGGGAVVMELRAMNEIVDIDEKSRLVQAQAGVLGPDLRNALATWGFMLGHEPQSVGISTIGGWIATRASGQLSSRYGAIEDLVAGLEAVLPSGRVARTRLAPRTSTGPGIASLMIGSEGTLGVVTEATLRISPLPEARFDRCIRFDQMANGVVACRKIVQAGLQPTLLRLYDREDATIFLRSSSDESDDPMLLLSFEGPRADHRAEEAVALSRGRRGDDAWVEHWWQHRNDAVDEFVTLMAGEGVLGPHGIVETIEVAGTWSVLRDLYHSMKDSLSPLADVTGCHLSHVYPDGACLYFTIAKACDSDDAAADALEQWWQVGMRTCLAAGGSISHHHGIGRRKARWLPEELGEWWDVLVAVKRALDPNRIMNPGALGL